VKHILVCFAIVLSVTLPTEASRSSGGPVKLTLYPAKVAEPAGTYRLLVKAEKQTDEDAMPLYEKAIQLMPKGVDRKQIQEWLKLPLERIPQKEAEEVVQKHIEILRLLARAARCKRCNWPEWDAPLDLNPYRELAFVIRLWARLDISRDEYKGALAAIQTGFGMARHLGQAPTIVQGLVGTAVGGLMCREIEQFVQGKDSPNLYAALADLPEPLIDIEKAIESEKQTGSALDRIRLISKRLANNLNGLQCVEAIRHYAATHDGQLPQALSDMKDMAIPNDLVSGKAFEYRLIATGAALQSAIPEGGNERDAVHYQIALRR